MSKQNRKLTRAVRERMERTGESYSTARMNLLASLGADPRSDRTTAVCAAPLSGTALRVQGVLDAQPDLGCFGFRAPAGRTRPSAGREDLAQERLRLLSDVGVYQVEKCLAYLSLVRKEHPDWQDDEAENILGSYVMKHEVEGWIQRTGGPGEDWYITNGAFIVAAILAGFPIHRVDISSPNCMTGINIEDVRALQLGKDPREWRVTTDFVAWLFEQAGRGDEVGLLGDDCKRDVDFPRTGNVSTIRAYLSRHGDHIQQWFKAARAEYRAAGQGVTGRITRCEACGFSYAPDVVADTSSHRRLHEALDALERIHGRRPAHYLAREAAKVAGYELRRTATTDEERLRAMEMICQAHFDRSIFPSGGSAAAVKQALRHPDFETFARAYDAEGVFGEQAVIFRRRYPYAPRPELRKGLTGWAPSARALDTRPPPP